jgi:adenine deaminase
MGASRQRLRRERCYGSPRLREVQRDCRPDAEGRCRHTRGNRYAQAYLVPGYSLQDELEQLAAAGLSPLQVLQTATINPAKEFKVSDLGTVEAGKIADLVLLDGNPLDDISNTRRIFGVVVNGRLVDKPALVALAKETRTLVAAWKGTPTGR